MIFDGIDFHNVAELVPANGGWRLSRFPAQICAHLTPAAQEASVFHASGIELRFRIRQGEAKLHLASVGAERLPALLYYGAFQGGWDRSALQINPESTCLTIYPPRNVERLRQITQERHLPFDPELIRVVLPYTHCLYLGVEGAVEPPHPGDTPERTLLSYGSSITHGSLALGNPQTYAARIARALGYDHLNLGLAGNCQLEEQLAHYLCSRQDWHAATLEMGINMLGFDEDTFRQRVRRFADIMAQDPRPVFATSLFCFTGDMQEKGRRFRQIVREEVSGKLPFIDGLALLDDPSLVAEDLVHPSFEAHEQIAQKWSAVIRKALAE